MFVHETPSRTSNKKTGEYGFNRVAVNNFSKLLGQIYYKKKMSDDRVYNTDKIGIGS